MSKSLSEKRIEYKYIVNKRHLKGFLALLDKFMKPAVMDDYNQSVVNESVYFDTADLQSIRDHLEKKQQRFKIRIRGYAHDISKQSGDLFIEKKIKNGDISEKERLQIGVDGYNSLINESKLPVDDELLVLNEDTVGEADTIMEANSLNKVLREGYKSVIRLNYKRVAYQIDETLRVTIDQDIRIKPLPALMSNAITDPKLLKKLKKEESKFLNFDDFILEVKFDKEIPKWLQSKLDKLFLEPAKFSKFCWAVSRTLNNEIKASL